MSLKCEHTAHRASSADCVLHATFYMLVTFAFWRSSRFEQQFAMKFSKVGQCVFQQSDPLPVTGHSRRSAATRRLVRQLCNLRFAQSAGPPAAAYPANRNASHTVGSTVLIPHKLVRKCFQFFNSPLENGVDKRSPPTVAEPHCQSRIVRIHTVRVQTVRILRGRLSMSFKWL